MSWYQPVRTYGIFPNVYTQLRYFCDKNKSGEAKPKATPSTSKSSQPTPSSTKQQGPAAKDKLKRASKSALKAPIKEKARKKTKLDPKKKKVNINENNFL